MKAASGWKKWLNAGTLGLLLLLAAVAISAYRVVTVHRELFNPDEIIIRICHWQLEAGYRDAMQAVIDEYEKEQLTRFNRKVRILQMPVTERVYGQWLNTHLISGDAPDLAEMGAAKIITSGQYVVRYFLPLTELVERPNPYNAGTPLEKVPWRETFIDGMRGGYQEVLQDYYGVPTTTYSLRIFYNRDLLRDATGTVEPPQSFGQLLQACAAVRALGDKRGARLIPIAGSSYSVGFFLWKYAVAFTAGFEPELDFLLDPQLTQLESYIGYVKGQYNFETPQVKAFYECLKTLCDQFSTGFTAMDRQQAAFLFVQGRAAMICTGSWDAESLYRQAKFKVGVMDFPLPAKGEKWGEWVAGRASEAGQTGAGNYGVYKYSRHQDIAIDFLHYLTSPRYNEIFNRKMNWPPIVIGAAPSDMMIPFALNPAGFTFALRFDYGAALSQLYYGQLYRYLQGEISYPDFTRGLDQALRNPQYGGDRGWVLDYDEKARTARTQERGLAVYSLRMLMEPEAKDASRKFKELLSQQVRSNNAEIYRYLFREVRNMPMPEK